MVEQLFSGAGIGLLLGLLLGLSSSPVVGLVVGALAALIASLVGLRLPGKDAPAEEVSAARRRTAAVRAGTFGFACTLGLIGGLYLRTHDSLSPTLQDRVAELKQVGFTEVEARQLAVLRTLDPGKAAPPRPTDRDKLAATVLFSEPTEKCARVAADRFQNIEAAIGAYRAMDEPGLAGVASTIQARLGDEKARMELLRSIVEALCARR